MLEEDEIEAEIEATKIASKGKGGFGESSQPMTIVPEKDEDAEAEGEMNKTRVEKMADLSVIGELKQETQFPNIELDAIVMSNQQYAGKTDFPSHIDLGDIYALSGQGFMHK